MENTYEELKKYHEVPLRLAYLVYKEALRRAIAANPPQEGFHYVVDLNGELVLISDNCEQ